MSQHIAQLVTIATVEKHPNADSLDLITFQEIGWCCIDKIGIRKPGDKVVYVPVDSLVDVTRPEFSFLVKDARADNKARIKTIRLRGIISQGLVVNIPNGIDPEVDENGTRHYTTALGIEKYVPADEDSLKSNLLIGNAKGTFPEWAIKSDAERCLSKDTLIDTNLGTFTIEYIYNHKDLPWKVRSYNIDENIDEYMDVIDYSRMRNNKDWVKIELENGESLIVTANHPIFLPELNCYRVASNLIAGDILKIN